MRHSLVAVATVVTAIFGAMFFGFGAAQTVPLLAPHVEVVEANGGHGSAVHIGNGLYLTAAHVAENESAGPLALRRSDGETQPAVVLWKSPLRDIALLAIEDHVWTRPAPINCAPLVVGQPVMAFGYPLDYGAIQSRGHVAGIHDIGGWKNAAVVAMVILPGMSGGGVVNEAGQLVGVSVGVGNGGGPFPDTLGLGFIVQSADFCRLLARQ